MPDDIRAADRVPGTEEFCSDYYHDNCGCVEKAMALLAEKDAALRAMTELHDAKHRDWQESESARVQMQTEIENLWKAALVALERGS